MSATILTSREASAAAPRETDNQTRPATSIPPTHRRPVARTRPRDRAGRGLRPVARPQGAVAAPTFASAATCEPRGCSVEKAVGAATSRLAPSLLTPSRLAQSSRTRLTDRGIAVILVVAAMIVLAAVTVVGLTAVRVTGDGTRPLTGSYANRP